MKNGIRAYNLIVLVLVLFAAVIVPKARAGSAAGHEYQIKAAFLYNFTMFVDWPKEKMADSNEPIIIGIIGKDPFGNAFEPIKSKLARERKVIIKRLEGLKELKKSGKKDTTELNQEIDAIKKCHLLFICRSEQKKLREIIDLVKGHSVLTIGDMPGFLEASGIINFVMEEKKVRFEINLTAAKQAKLQISSKLLRLAKRIVEEKQSDEAKN